MRTLRDGAGAELDRALTLWLPGPATSTGEEIAELHLHGGRAVIAGVLSALRAIDGLHDAEPGEFTRQALTNQRIDLAQAEGLAELLRADSEWHRKRAAAIAGGATSRRLDDWRSRLIRLGAAVEAEIDFSDEDDVASDPARLARVAGEVDDLKREIAQWLALPPIDQWREGLRVVIAGPPNAGKSTLLNAIAGRDAAIVSPEAGTTRDVVEVPLLIGDTAVRLADTAGLREGEGVGAVESAGVKRAIAQIGAADLLLWLGPPAECPPHANCLRVSSKADIDGVHPLTDLAVSARTGEGMAELLAAVSGRLAGLQPAQLSLPTRRQQQIGAEVVASLDGSLDPLLLAEQLRLALFAMDRLDGRVASDEMLGALFGNFCIGK